MVRYIREWMGAGVPRGLQIRLASTNTTRGEFDSHPFPQKDDAGFIPALSFGELFYFPLCEGGITRILMQSGEAL